MPPNKCLCLVTPANLYTTWWASWAFALGGALVGLLLTLAFLHLVKGLVRLSLSGCQPKRAWPDCCCWKEVSLELHPQRALREETSVFVLQISATNVLVNDDVEDSLSDTSLAAQSPSLVQQLRAKCCTCLGHHG